MTTFTVTDRDGNAVQAGDTITDFRGDSGVFQEVERGPQPGKSAKVRVYVHEGSYTTTSYANAWGLTVEPAWTTVPVPQSRPARAAMLVQWAEQDPEWHTSDLLRELVALVRDVIPADALALGAMANIHSATDALNVESEAILALADRALASTVAGGSAQLLNDHEIRRPADCAGCGHQYLEHGPTPLVRPYGWCRTVPCPCGRYQPAGQL